MRALALWQPWPAVSDDIAVGGPGSTSVLTTELVQEARLLMQLGWEMEGFQRDLRALDRVVGNGILVASDAPLSALNAENAIDEASAAMAQAQEQCDRIRGALSKAAEYYEWTEHTVGVLEQHVAALLGYLLGRIAPLLVRVMLPGVVIAAGGTALFLARLPESTRAALFNAIGSWLQDKSGSLTDPRVVTAVRLSVMSADDFGAGVVGIPPEIVAALGDEGLGVFGLNTSALLLLGLGGGLGLLRETPVRVTEGATTQGVADVRNIKDRLERIPSNPEQIRIDRISQPGLPDSFDVYIGGTEDFSPESGTEPFDLTSNVAAVAEGSDGAGSYRAVVEAMKLAGMDASSHVEFNGYSQGGLIAAQLAASGDYTVDGLVTIAAPAGQVAVPHSIPYLAIEHADDLVPALGGFFTSSDPVVVSRRAFDSPPMGDQPVMPAHRLTHYMDTAELIDESTNVRLRDIIQQLAHPHSESITSTLYFAERVTP